MATIMIVDDEPDIVILVQRILQKDGHEVIGAESGIQALEKLKEVKHNLILLDIMMSRLDGWETLKLIREEEGLKDVPVSMLTAKILTPDIVRREDIGEIMDYIQKPIRKDNLIKKVSEILGVLENIAEKKAKLKTEIDEETVSAYEVVARAEPLHKSMLKTLEGLFGTAAALNSGGSVNEDIQSQQRTVEMFKKKRIEIEARLLGEENTNI